MKFKTFATAVAAVTMSTAALAADLPSRRAPPVAVVAVPVFTWTGFYAGVQVGYVTDKVNYRTWWGYQGSTGYGNGGWGRGNMDGITGGGHVGYLWQGSNPFVFGVEGSFEGTSVSHSNWGAGIRGRVGYSFDRVLVYATGGVSFIDLKHRYNDIYGYQSWDKVKVGWSVGGGVEYALNDKWSIRAEYRYSQLGDDTLNVPWAGPTRVRGEQHSVRGGVSYHFNWNTVTPVVARY